MICDATIHLFQLLQKLVFLYCNGLRLWFYLSLSLWPLHDDNWRKTDSSRYLLDPTRSPPYPFRR